MSKQFVHLHNHTDKSILDGQCPMEGMVSTASRHKAPGVGTSEHGNMASIYELLKYTAEYDLKPIPGVEFYRARDRFSNEKTPAGKMNWHLPVWALNDTGFSNLVKVTSASADSVFKKKYPRVDDELLSGHTDGLIATSGCLGSEVLQLLLLGDEDRALEAAATHQDMFGKENYFVEVQRHQIKAQESIMQPLLRLARKLDAPLLATNDVHYVNHDDHHTHDALLCCQIGKKLADDTRWRFESPDQHYFKSPEEMWALFPEEDFPGACANTLWIAERVESLSIKANGNDYLLPTFPIPEGFESAADYLRHLTNEGLHKRYGAVVPSGHHQRAEYELDVIISMGFPEYLLMVADYVMWAKNNGVIVGPGRGSAAGSLVAFALGITGIDPMRNGLLFERFLNPDRISMPDIDVDFDPIGRYKVLNYLIDKYGKDRVAHIATWGKFGGKSAIKGAASIQSIPSAAKEFLARGYPVLPQTAKKPKIKDIIEWIESPYGNVDGIDPAVQEVIMSHMAPFRNRWDYEPDPDETGSAGKTPIAKQYYGMDQNMVQDIYRMAAAFDGITSQRGTHACGFLITPEPLWEHLPVHFALGDDTPVNYVVDADATEVEAFGGIKFDLLGLINLQTISRAQELVLAATGEPLDITEVPLDDPNVYEMLSRGDTSGVFQLESDGMRELLRNLKPREFSDISAVLALYRPGPMASDFHIKFANRKNGQETIDAPHEDMIELLAETEALPIYQESIMLIARHFAGFTPGQADTFRKAIGKKKADILAKYKMEFIEGCESQGFGSDLGVELWNIIEPFAGYAFCKAHAASYALISYWTAYLKANHPAEFVAACIDTVNRQRIAQQAESARRYGIKVHYPDINISERQCVTKDGEVFLGLSTIVQNSKKATFELEDSITEERRKNGRYNSLPDFVQRTKANKSKVQLLVSAGAFDSLHSSRKAMYDSASAIIKDERNTEVFGELDLFADEESSEYQVWNLDGADWTDAMRLKMEEKALGFFVGVHPYEALVKPHLHKLKSSGLVPYSATQVQPARAQLEHSGKSEKWVTIIGIISGIEHKTTRNSSEMSKFTIETGNDEADRTKAIYFKGALDKDMNVTPVVVKGKLQSEIKEDDTHEYTLIVNELVPLGEEVDQLSAAQEKDGSEDDHYEAAHDLVFTVHNVSQIKSLARLIKRRGLGDKNVYIDYKGAQGVERYPVNPPPEERERCKLNGWNLPLSTAKAMASEVEGVTLTWTLRGSGDDDDE